MEEYLDNFKSQKLWKLEYNIVLIDYINDQENQKLYVWIDMKEKWLMLSTSGVPTLEDRIEQFQMLFFVKVNPHEAITISNISKVIYVDTCDRDPLDDLLNKMNSNYLNIFLQDKSWSDGMRKDFILVLHKYISALTEASHISKGRTTLYNSADDLSDIEAVAKDKDLLQRLESTVIFCTRQIKEVVSNQESQNSNNTSSSLLDKINILTSRTNNLDALYKQLQKPELKKICAILKAADSSYLQSFKELEAKIEEGSLEAADNLKYLKLLSEPCKQIENATPKEIPALLQEVLKYVRVIWEMSTHYISYDKMKGLLTKISNQIIKRWRAKIDIWDMF